LPIQQGAVEPVHTHLVQRGAGLPGAPR
jgi:hypothetical protein